MIRLWRLSTRDPIGYDEYDAFIVRASSEHEARTIAARAAADEGADQWLLPARSTCEPLELDGSVGVVLGSFNAG